MDSLIKLEMRFYEVDVFITGKLVFIDFTDLEIHFRANNTVNRL